MNDLGRHLQLSGEGPLYQQLADALRQKILMQELPYGSKLPTVRELADIASLSRGTVKHAYNQLETEGLIELTQGKGSFVSWQSEDRLKISSKDRALQAIVLLFETLERLGFSEREAEILIELQRRQQEAAAARLQVGLAEDSPEMRTYLQQSLERLPQLELYRYRIDELRQMSPDDLRPLDALVTTEPYFRELELFARDVSNVLLLNFTLSSKSIVQLTALHASQRLVCLAFSKTYLAQLLRQIEPFLAEGLRPQPFLLSDPDLKASLQRCDVLLLPEAYAAFAEPETEAEIRHFAKQGGQIVELALAVERGTLLYTQNRLERLETRKRAAGAKRAVGQVHPY